MEKFILTDEIINTELTGSLMKSLLSYSEKNPAAFFNERSKSQTFLNNLVNLMNNRDAGIKNHTLALLIYSNLALFKQGRGYLLEHLKSLNNVLEIHMAHKERGRTSFGTNLGKLHELVLVTLIRICNYKLKAIEVLELFHGDLDLSLTVISGAFKVLVYEV